MFLGQFVHMVTDFLREVFRPLWIIKNANLLLVESSADCLGMADIRQRSLDDQFDRSNGGRYKHETWGVSARTIV